MKAQGTLGKFEFQRLLHTEPHSFHTNSKSQNVCSKRIRKRLFTFVTRPQKIFLSCVFLPCCRLSNG